MANCKNIRILLGCLSGLVLGASTSAVQAQASPKPEQETAAAPSIVEKLGIRAYGTIKPTIMFGNGVESFGFANFVAPTAAANPLFLPNPDATALSFQVQQTRLGLMVGEGSPLKAQAEIDFVDFSKSSPAQSTTPRLRQAFLEWTINPHHRVTLGQLWDVFSPLNSHTYNLVGGLFQSGNVGFMRQQAIYVATLRQVEIAFALGMTNQNLNAGLGNVEYGRVPTSTLRVSYRLEKKLWIGVAGTATRVAFDAESASQRNRVAAGGNLFAELNGTSSSLRAEAYAGQNLNNLGLLALGQGTRTRDVSEVGGYVSGKHVFNPEHAVHLVTGGAFVLDPRELALGYQPAVAATETTAARALTRVAANGPGITRNITLRVGYSYTPLKGFSLVCEPYLLATRHKLDSAARAQYDRDRLALGVEAGGLYAF